MSQERFQTSEPRTICPPSGSVQKVAWNILTCLLLAMTLIASSGREASAASTTVHVRARVLPWLKVDAQPRVSSYQVDREDIARGYVDLPHSLTIRLSTNLRQDILLDLQSFGPEQIKVLSPSGNGIGAVRITTVGSNLPTHHEFDLRILLPEGVQEGTYPFQMNVSALNI